MTSTPTIRELSPGDMDAYAALCEARDDLDGPAAKERARQVEWLAFHNPHADGNPTYFVIELGDRLLGHLGRMPTIFQVQGEQHQASFIHDLFVHPELVASGQDVSLISDMYRLAEDASKSFSALAFADERSLGVAKARKYRPMWTPRHVKLLRADAQIDKHIPAAGVASASKPLAAAALRLMDRALAAALAAPQRIVTVERFDERFDRFAARMLGRVGISPYKDQRYLNWKYADRPGVDSIHYASVDGTGELTGFVVLAHAPGEHHEASMLELVADPEDEKTIMALVHRATEHCRQAGAHSLQCMGSDPRFAAVLKKFLFMPKIPSEPLFLANPERCRQPERLIDPGAWHASLGDAEGAR